MRCLWYCTFSHYLVLTSPTVLKSQSYNNELLQGNTALEELTLVSGFQRITGNWAKITPL